MKKMTKILTAFLIFFIGTIICNAQVTTYDRTTLNNYGVNKKWKITSSNKSNVLNTPLVDASKKIYDFSDILTEEEEQELYIKIQEFINTSKMDMVIVTVDLPYSYDSKNEDYAADFYDYNDFGIDFKKYDGVLLLRNTYSLDPYFDIYTFGDAQLYFSYNRLNNVLDYIYPDLKSHNYLDGFTDFVTRMTSYYNRGIPSEMKQYDVDENGFLFKIYRVPFIPIILISGVVTLITMLIMVNKNKMVAKATKASVYLDQPSLHFTNRQDQFITSHTTSYTRSSSSGGGGGGFRSSGGSSGGGHSSGGGRHG